LRHSASLRAARNFCFLRFGESWGVDMGRIDTTKGGRISSGRPATQRRSGGRARPALRGATSSGSRFDPSERW
jgi:hypothetical protein